MIIDCISDLHGHYPKLEGGDLLIVAGDLTTSDQYLQYEDFFEWLEQQNYKNKILIAGNHDNHLEMVIDEQICDDEVAYLCDSGTEFEGLKIWGSPWTTRFAGMNPKCMAFTVDTDDDLASKFSLIPEDVDILITHSPAFGILDGIEMEDGTEYHAGSISLRNMVLSSDRLPKLKLHVFGHIHEHGGKTFETTLTKFVNASHVNEHYKPVNKPVRIEL